MYQMIFILWKSITKAVSISCVSNWLSYLARYYHDTTLDQGNLAHTPQSPLMPYPTNDTCGKNHINHPIHNTLPESDTHADASVSDNTTIQYILASQGRITCNTIHSLTSFASRILPHSLATLAHVALAPWGQRPRGCLAFALGWPRRGVRVFWCVCGHVVECLVLGASRKSLFVVQKLNVYASSAGGRRLRLAIIGRAGRRLAVGVCF